MNFLPSRASLSIPFELDDFSIVAKLWASSITNNKLFSAFPFCKAKALEIAFEIKFKMGYQYFQISPNDIETDYSQTTNKLDILGKKLESIILSSEIRK